MVNKAGEGSLVGIWLLALIGGEHNSLTCLDKVKASLAQLSQFGPISHKPPGLRRNNKQTAGANNVVHTLVYSSQMIHNWAKEIFIWSWLQYSAKPVCKLRGYDF